MCLGLAFVGTGVQKAYSYTVLLEDYSNLFPQTTRAWYRVFFFFFQLVVAHSTVAKPLCGV